MIKKISTLLFALLVVSQYSLADNLKAFFKLLENSDKKIKILKADFTQELSFDGQKEKQTTKGKVIVKKPNFTLIDQKTPQEQKIFIENQKITIYTPENKQAIVNSWNNAVDGKFNFTFILNFADEKENIQKTNDISLISETERYYEICLEPKDKNGWVANVFISKETMLVEKAVLKSAGSITEVRFSDYEINPDISKSIFRTKFPKDTEIISLN
jgi:outer membrane lipoprotein carrier protein